MRAVLAVTLLVLVALGASGEVPLADFEVFELENGLTLYTAEDHYQPVVFVRAVVRSGGCANPAGKAGLDLLTVRAAASGVPGIETRSAIEEAFGRLGAGHSYWTSCDGTFFSMDVISETWREALPLFASILTDPTFPNDEIDRIRDQWLVDLESSRDDPASLAQAHMNGVLRGVNGPVEREIRSLSRSDVLGFYRTHYLPNRTAVVAIGDFETGAFVAAVEEAFGGWARGEEPEPPEPPVLREDRPDVRLVHKPGLSQATIAWGCEGLSRNDPDRYAFLLANRAFGGGGFSSRLMLAVRGERGRTYGISSWNDGTSEYGTYQVRTTTRNEGLRATMETIRGIADEFGDEGVTPEELGKARSYVLGGIPLRFETPSQAAGQVVRNLSVGQTIDDLRALPERYGTVTLEDARSAFSTRIDPSEMTWVVVGDERAIADELAGLGVIERRYYKELPGEVGLLERTRIGLGIDWGGAVRGPRLSVLHRWLGLSATYGIERSDDPWDHDRGYGVSVDVHQENSEYSTTSLYAGASYMRSDEFRGFGPHVGFRVFPRALGDHSSIFVRCGRLAWRDEPAGEELPDWIWSFGFDYFFR